MKKVLVVGGAGYIGGSVTDALIAKKIPFTVYDNLTYENHYFKPVDFIYGDIRDHKKLKSILPGYSHVIWLAALVGDGACAINETLTREINELSVKWLSENFDGRIMFTSTCSVYGAQEEPVNEDSPTGPLSAYARTKLAAESYLKNKNAMIFRLGTAYGISDTYARLRMDLAINYMTMNAVTKKSLTVFGGKQWRPFCHVRDIGRFLVDNLEKEQTGIFNIATENRTIIDIAKSIQKVTKCEIQITEQKFQDSRNYNASTEKALKNKIIPASTENVVEFGIKQIKELVEANRVNNLEHEFYSNERRMLAIIDSYKNGVSETTISQSEVVVEKEQKEQGIPRIIEGGLAVDDRGKLSFVNNYDFKDVKRFYTVSNHQDVFIRAWHAHKKEEKYVLVIEGSAIIGAVKVDDWDNPSKDAPVSRFVLSADKPSVLHIPAGYANGFKTLTKGTKVIFFSTTTIEEAKDDDYRFDAHYWDIWSVVAR